MWRLSNIIGLLFLSSEGKRESLLSISLHGAGSEATSSGVVVPSTNPIESLRDAEKEVHKLYAEGLESRKKVHAVLEAYNAAKKTVDDASSELTDLEKKDTENTEMERDTLVSKLQILKDAETVYNEKEGIRKSREAKFHEEETKLRAVASEFAIAQNAAKEAEQQKNNSKGDYDYWTVVYDNLKKKRNEDLARQRDAKAQAEQNSEDAKGKFNVADGAVRSLKEAYAKAKMQRDSLNKAVVAYYESQPEPKPKVLMNKHYTEPTAVQEVYFLKADEMETIFRKQSFRQKLVRSVSVRLLDKIQKVSDDNWDTIDKVDDKELGKVLHRFVQIQGVPRANGGDKINGLYFRIDRKASKNLFVGLKAAYKKFDQWASQNGKLTEAQDGNYIRVGWDHQSTWAFSQSINISLAGLDVKLTPPDELEKLHEAFVNVIKDKDGRLPIYLPGFFQWIQKKGQVPTGNQLKDHALWTSEDEGQYEIPKTDQRSKRKEITDRREQ